MKEVALQVAQVAAGVFIGTLAAQAVNTYVLKPHAEKLAAK